MNGWNNCPVCHGKVKAACPMCGGTGRTSNGRCNTCDGGGMINCTFNRKHSRCKGTGRLTNEWGRDAGECEDCGGSGVAP